MSIDTPNFIGKSGFIWFYGVVENRSDPLKVGRCQVRIHGWHTEDKALIPTEDLVWAHGAYSLSDTSPTPPKEGSMVQGYFADGISGQFPVITHIIPGIPEATPPIDKGFSDQRDDSKLSDSPREPKSRNYKTDGSGITITEESKAKRNPFIVDEPTTSRLARNEKISETFIQTRKDSVVTSVATATGGTWSEPKTVYGAKYPWNRVIHTESGHIIEMDDTPGSERVHIAHRSGSFIEMFPNGDVVVKATKSKYEIVMADDNLYIMGDSSITVQGDSKIYTKGDMTVKVDGSMEATVEGNIDVTTRGSMSCRASRDINLTASRFVNIRGTKIFLN